MEVHRWNNTALISDRLYITDWKARMLEQFLFILQKKAGELNANRVSGVVIGSASNQRNARVILLDTGLRSFDEVFWF